VFVQKTGVNVHAHFRYPSGLQEIGTSVVKALNHEGIPCAKRDLPVGMARGPLFEGRAQDLEIYPTTVVVAGANTKPADFYRISGLSPRDGVKRIAYVFWELEHVPASWAERLSWADEIWAPTQFIASAFRKVVQVPVIPMLPGVELPTFEPLPRSHFGLPEHVKLFLFTFDMNSTFERKNPLAVIRAFRRAARPSDNAMLVVKVSRGESSPADLAVLRKECDATGVILIDRVMSRGEVLALMNSADCYISLHRSEGLGLGMVESLMMGKPVIGTDYSGNQDFLTEVTGYPVQAGRTLVGNSNKEYPAGSVWAEPDVIHAAERIRWILDQPEEARAKGDLAREVITKQFQFRTFGERIRARLNQSSASSLPSQ
jgi:glycosyltransferase involved in cell wall biosynthesis